jgi:SAM-dependent methyltransferase
MDLEVIDVMLTADLQDMPFPDDCFDAVICCHVLEHIHDDRRGMREIRRVLKPHGWAILQAPMALALSSTIEDPSVKDEAERIRRFGQRDHVRMYSPNDYPERLRASGFIVSTIDYPQQMGSAVIERYALTAGEVVYFCQR